MINKKLNKKLIAVFFVVVFSISGMIVLHVKSNNNYNVQNSNNVNSFSTTANAPINYYSYIHLPYSSTNTISNVKFFANYELGYINSSNDVIIFNYSSMKYTNISGLSIQSNCFTVYNNNSNNIIFYVSTTPSYDYYNVNTKTNTVIGLPSGSSLSSTDTFMILSLGNYIVFSHKNTKNQIQYFLYKILTSSPILISGTSLFSSYYNIYQNGLNEFDNSSTDYSYLVYSFTKNTCIGNPSFNPINIYYMKNITSLENITNQNLLAFTKFINTSSDYSFNTTTALIGSTSINKLNYINFNISATSIYPHIQTENAFINNSNLCFNNKSYLTGDNNFIIGNKNIYVYNQTSHNLEIFSITNSNYILNIRSYNKQSLEINNNFLFNGIIISDLVYTQINLILPQKILPLNYSVYNYNGSYILIQKSDFIQSGNNNYYDNISIYYNVIGTPSAPILQIWVYMPIISILMLFIMSGIIINGVRKTKRGYA
ncbi:MAG: hypothetical protein ACYDAO_10020 [Thermoplasmataceae archaeon]